MAELSIPMTHIVVIKRSVFFEIFFPPLDINMRYEVDYIFFVGTNYGSFPILIHFDGFDTYL